MSLAIKSALQARASAGFSAPRALQATSDGGGLFGQIGGLFKRGLTSVGRKIVGALTGATQGPRTPGGVPFPGGGGIVQQVPRGGFQVPPELVVPVPGIGGAIQRFLPGGQTGLQVQTSGVGSPKGFHLNKSSYFLKNGTFIEKGTVFVKNRRRNPLNPRALRNAIGRVDAGKIWQGKLAEISTGKFTSAGNRKACPN